MQVCRETSYVDVEKLILKEMCWSVADGVLETNVVSLLEQFDTSCNGSSVGRCDVLSNIFNLLNRMRSTVSF